MSKHRKKKKKNKKQVSNVIDQATQNVVVENPQIQNELIQNELIENPTAILAHQTVKKDLIRIFVISLVLLMILAGGIIIRSQTFWFSRGADWIYAWMRLGE